MPQLCLYPERMTWTMIMNSLAREHGRIEMNSGASSEVGEEN